ncbi:unnamed protein product [Owenia fusiformis]|uniref:Uncharacterized protein n=1 Tax=Owenia fusiformis TaxID=6347 RepID=A0A8J1T7T3_OWEFU|nr:unnamed protein product [Owenia fusiformis]
MKDYRSVLLGLVVIISLFSLVSSWESCNLQGRYITCPSYCCGSYSNRYCCTSCSLRYPRPTSTCSTLTSGVIVGIVIGGLILTLVPFIICCICCCACCECCRSRVRNRGHVIRTVQTGGTTVVTTSNMQPGVMVQPPAYPGNGQINQGYAPYPAQNQYPGQYPTGQAAYPGQQTYPGQQPYPGQAQQAYPGQPGQNPAMQAAGAPPAYSDMNTYSKPADPPQ